MKKEYLILIALIIGLGAFLMLKKDNQVHYDLPELAKVDTETVDRIDITTKEKTLVLSRSGEDKTWTITDQAYPVDAAAIREMLDIIRDLKVSALVSEGADLVRYDLDMDNRIQVKALAKDKIIREFTIGKPAPSFNHTFVMLASDKRVFQADKSFRNDFDKSVEDLRDKVILSFKSPEIKALTLEKDGAAKTFTLTPAEADAPKEGEADAAAKPAEDAWLAADGSPADKAAIQDLLSSLSRLECQGYKTEEQAQAIAKETPSCKINLENGKQLGLTLFEIKDGEAVAGTSSATPYAFDLASYKAGDIITYIDKLLGLTKEEKPSE